MWPSGRWKGSKSVSENEPNPTHLDLVAAVETAPVFWYSASSSLYLSFSLSASSVHFCKQRWRTWTRQHWTLRLQQQRQLHPFFGTHRSEGKIVLRSFSPPAFEHFQCVNMKAINLWSESLELVCSPTCHPGFSIVPQPSCSALWLRDLGTSLSVQAWSLLATPCRLSVASWGHLGPSSASLTVFLPFLPSLPTRGYTRDQLGSVVRTKCESYLHTHPKPMCITSDHTTHTPLSSSWSVSFPSFAS